MKETLKDLKERRSCRAYKPELPPQELIDEVINAGVYAPSGMGKQSAIIIAVTDKEMRDRLSAMNAAILGITGDPFYGAPAVLVVLADRKIPTFRCDGSLVLGNLMNAAHAVGLGSCWIHRAKEEFESEEGKKILEKLGITGDYEGIGHCILGYPAEGGIREAAPRKSNYIYRI